MVRALFQRRLAAPQWLVVGLFVTATGGGCTAMEGVNVGASLPVGGIGRVGANKTIGTGSSGQRQQTPAQAPTTAESDDSSENSSENSSGNSSENSSENSSDDG